MNLKSCISAAIHILIGFILTFLPHYVTVLFSLIVGSNNSILLTMITNVVLIGVFTTLYCIFRFKRREEAFQIHSKFSVKVLLLFMVLIVVLSFAMNTIFYWFSVHISSAGMDTRADNYRSVTVFTLILFSVILAPICEEIMYRWFMYNFFKRRLHWLAAMIISSLFFGMVHMTGPHLVIGTVFGMFMCLCYELSGSCFVSILLHITYNFLSLFVPSAKLGSSTAFAIFCMIMVLGIFSIQMFAADGYIQKNKKVLAKVEKVKTKS